MNKILRAVWAVGCVGMVACLAGCNMISTFEYPDDEATLYRASARRASGKVVAVLPFEDCRSTQNNRAGIWLTFVPLFPYGWYDLSRPEDHALLTAVRYKVKPSEDLARAAVVSLSRSGLFREAFFATSAEKDRADFVVSGRVKEFRYVGKEIRYGLSFFGELLWYFGLPAGKSEDIVACDLEMRDRSGKRVWSHSFRCQTDVWAGLYYNFGNDCTGYPESCQNGLNEAMADLDSQMNAHPERFRQGAAAK